MAKIVMIVAPKDFNDTELLETKAELERIGHKVDIASQGRGQIKGMFGAVVVPDLQTFDIRPSNYDALVLVGGSGAKAYFGDREIDNLVYDFYNSQKVIAAICIAPHILAEVGILDGTPATCFSSETSFLQEQGALIQQKPVVRSRNIITANGPAASMVFAKTISVAIQEKKGMKPSSFI